MSPIYIAEVNGSGHRLVYVRLLVEAAIKQDIRIVVGIPQEVRGGEEFHQHLGSVENRFQVDILTGAMSLPLLYERMHRTGCSRLIVPDGDVYLTQPWQAWRVPHPERVTLLVMRDPRWVLEGRSRLLVRPRSKAAVLRFVELHSGLDMVWLREPGYRGAAGERYATDPVILDGDPLDIMRAGRLYRDQHALAPEVFWFGVSGALTARKNIDLVVESIIDLPRGRPVGLALMGPIGADVGWRLEDLAASCASRGRHFFADTRLTSNYEMNVRLAAMDAVVMAYSSHSPNSTMGKAARLGIRLVVAGPPSVRRFAYSVCGRAGVRLKLDDLRAAMTVALSLPRPRAREDLGDEQFCCSLLEGAN